MSRIENLYQEKIMELAKSSIHFFELKSPSHVFTAYNPLCGDKFTFYLLAENGKIKEASFSGFGCAISKASSSLLVSKLIDNELTNLSMLVNDFLITIDSSSRGKIPDVVYAPFLAVREFPERISCVTLGWKELENQLKQNNLS
jgi:nitrogen fixation NifU-like protein